MKKETGINCRYSMWQLLHRAAVGIAALMLLLCLFTGTEVIKADTALPDITQIHYNSNGLSYTFTGSTETESGYIANVEGYLSGAIQTNGVLEIPDTITYNNGTTDLEIPVAGILTGAFSGCTSLTQLTLPQSVTYIGQEAFANCTNLNKISTRGLTGTGNITTAAEIEYRAFYGCTSLEGITLGATTTGNGVKRVGSEAFMNCTALKSFTVGSTVTDIGGGVIAGCEKIDGAANQILVVDNSHFFVQDGILYQRINNTNNVLVQCPPAKAVDSDTKFADYLTQINDEAFYGCTKVFSITVPDTVTTIGSRAFYNCTSLGNVTIPDSVISIGAQAFQNCSSALSFLCSSGSVANTYAANNGINSNATCTVTFFNSYTNQTVTRSVLSGGTVTPPTGWSRDGYVLRWSNNYDASTIITSNMTVTTEWKKLYTVTFRDSYTKNEAVQTNVEEGTTATPPSWTRSGYELTWSTEGYKNVTSDLTVNAIWLVSLTDNTITEPTYKVGDTVVISNIRYKITDTDSNYVKVVGLKNQNVATVTIPDTVAFGGKTYYVKAIARKSFMDNTNLQGVSIGKYVNTIGRYAFYGCTKLRLVKIYSKGLSTVALYSFKNTKSTMRVYAPTTTLAKRYRVRLQDAGMSESAVVKKLP